MTTTDNLDFKHHNYKEMRQVGKEASASSPGYDEWVQAYGTWIIPVKNYIKQCLQSIYFFLF